MVDTDGRVWCDDGEVVDVDFGWLTEDLDSDSEETKKYKQENMERDKMDAEDRAAAVVRGWEADQAAAAADREMHKTDQGDVSGGHCGGTGTGGEIGGGGGEEGCGGREAAEEDETMNAG